MSFLGGLVSGGLGLIGGILGNRAAKDMAEDNVAYQREFAQNGIRWRAEDARAAGLHPLYAMGLQPSSFSPSYVGDSLSSSFAQAGSEFGRAIDAGRTASERSQAKIEALSVERAELENDLLRSQIAKNLQPGHPPAFPEFGAVENKPSEFTSTRLGDSATEAASPAPAVKEFYNRDGSVTIWPSQDAKNAIEDVLPYEIEHMFRNRVIPYLQEQGRSIRRAYDNVWWNPRNW